MAWARSASGAEPPAATAAADAREHAAAAMVVALWIDGALPLERRRALERLVRAELAPHRVTVEVDTRTPLQNWSDTTYGDPRVLLAAALDSDESGWRLSIHHGARGRTLERRLPGGADTDAAALEAVATILESAVSALREGGALEEDEIPGKTDSAERAPAAPRAPAPAKPAKASDEARPRFGVLGTLGGTVALPGEGVLVGAGASVTLRVPPRFGVRLGARLYFPKQVESAYGTFRFQRSTLDLRGQGALAAGPWTLLPELGAVLELVRRQDTAPESGVIAAADASRLRPGAAAGLRATYPLSDFLALELGAHIEWYLRGLRFSAASSPRDEIFSLEPFSLAGEIGVAFGQL